MTCRHHRNKKNKNEKTKRIKKLHDTNLLLEDIYASLRPKSKKDEDAKSLILFDFKLDVLRRIKNGQKNDI